jgi:hypothetical protein
MKTYKGLKERNNVDVYFFGYWIILLMLLIIANYFKCN